MIPAVGLDVTPDGQAAAAWPGAAASSWSTGGERSVAPPDGDTLRWLVIAHPEQKPWIACFRNDDGGLHESEGPRLLMEVGRADAELPTMHELPNRGLGR